MTQDHTRFRVERKNESINRCGALEAISRQKLVIFGQLVISAEQPRGNSQISNLPGGATLGLAWNDRMRSVAMASACAGVRFSCSSVIGALGTSTLSGTMATWAGP